MPWRSTPPIYTQQTQEVPTDLTTCAEMRESRESQLNAQWPSVKRPTTSARLRFSRIPTIHAQKLVRHSLRDGMGRYPLADDKK